MKKIYAVIVGLFLTLSMTVNGQSIHKDYLDGHIWVKLSNDYPIRIEMDKQGNTQPFNNLTAYNLPFLSELKDNAGIEKVSKPWFMVSDQRISNVLRIEFTNYAAVDQLIRQLEGYDFIEYAEKVPLLRKTLTPNDPSYNTSNQWSLFQVNAEQAWDISIGNSNVVVAIVDDAVEITHNDLAPVIWTNTGEVPNNGVDDDGNGYIDDVDGFDVADGDNDPNPDAPISSYDHGTHVAGIAGAASDNNTGVASIGFGVSIMAVKSTNSAQFVTHGYDGIVYSVSSGADVVNMSWGGSGSSTTAQNIIDWAYNNGTVLIAAAGNDNVSSPFYPANYNHVVAVASTTTGDVKSGFSNYGNWIDVSAPGSGIYSTVPGNGYAIKQGTSMASPMVAGLAGLMLSLNPGLPVDDVVNCILNTADDIDPVNPSYTGELGSGRINALAAMNCVAATLNLPPQAEFSGNPVIILEGQTVDFTDLSIYNPTSWSWSFPGGTPSTFNGQTPPSITYNTAGTYDVTLTVTNANGNDTETKTDYITVNSLSGCDTISNTLPSDPNSTFSWSAPEDGYIFGHSTLGATEFAERYTGLGPTNVTGSYFYFTVGETVNPASVVTITVWDDNAGEPGAVVYTQDVPLEDIEANVTGPGPGSFFITNVNFDSPAAVTTTDFFVGYQITYSGQDSVACATSGNLSATARNNSGWCYFPAGNAGGYPAGWYDVPTLTGGGAELALHIYPRITDAPPTAAITANPTTACEGDFVTFDGSTSTNGVNFEWAINGTNTPFPTGATPNVLMTAPGNHWVYMLAYNYCGFSDIDSTQYTVNATPSISVSSTSTLICPGDNITITASGATTYSWNPGGQSSASINVSPTTNTTYTVTGTSGGCSSDAFIDISVDDNPPVGEVVVSADTICEGETITFNGGLSSNTSTYDWTFTGGDIATSNSATPTVAYAAQGSYTYDLTVTNNCAQTDQVSGTVVVEPASACSGVGIDETSLEGISAQFFHNYGIVRVNFPADLSGETNMAILNSVGQIVSTQQLFNIAGGSTLDITSGQLATGMYILQIEHEGDVHAVKFVK